MLSMVGHFLAQTQHAQKHKMANICRSLQKKEKKFPVLKSPTQIRFIGVKKNVSKISHLGTFNNVGVYLVQVSLLLIGHQNLGHFFRYRSLLPIGLRIVQIVRQRRRKTNNTSPTTLRAIQAASNSTFINSQLYSTCD
jgi:hypothetical protein